VARGHRSPKSCPAPQFLIGSIVISLSRCCLPNDEGQPPLLSPNIFPRTVNCHCTATVPENKVVCENPSWNRTRSRPRSDDEMQSYGHLKFSIMPEWAMRSVIGQSLRVRSMYVFRLIFVLSVFAATAQGLFPAGTPGNGVPKVILTVGTAFPGTQ